MDVRSTAPNSQRVLLVKLCLVTAVFALGASNSAASTTSPGERTSRGPHPPMLRDGDAAALLVLLVTALLVSLPAPVVLVLSMLAPGGPPLYPSLDPGLTVAW